MLMTFEEQVAAASEAAAADAYRAAFDPPARLWQPQRMTADEHAAVIRNSLSHGREVRYWVGQKQYKQKVSEFAWECLINDDSVASILADAMRIEASGASDADIAAAFKRFCKASADCAGVAAEAIDEDRGFSPTYTGAGHEVGLIEYEAERHVTLRQRLSDIAWLAGTIIGTIIVIRWFARVSLESGWLVP